MKTIDLYSEDLASEILNLPYSNCVNLDGGNVIFIPESDYGFAEIFRLYEDIMVFLIPTYGGIPSFYKCYKNHSVEHLVKELRSMT